MMTNVKTHSAPLNIVIFGAGSIGCYLGGQLANGGANVTFVGRERFQRDLKINGLSLSHFKKATIHVAQDRFVFSLSPQVLSAADIVLVCVKSQDSAEAAELLALYARADALIISFQNGISNAHVLSGGLPYHAVLGGVVPFNVTGTGPGAFHSGTEGDLIVQNTDDARLERLSAVFTASEQRLEVVPDIKAVQWGKLLVNLNNAMNALSGGTLHQGLGQRAYRLALALMIEEALNVLRGANITPVQFGKASIDQTLKILRLPTPLFKVIMALVLRIDKTARSSMLDDLEMGRTPEIDYLQGEITALAKRTGQSAPINAAIMAAVKMAFEKGSSPKLSGAQILTVCRAAV